MRPHNLCQRAVGIAGRIVIGEYFETLREYLAIVVGLLVGAIAHFGARLASDDDMSWRQVAGYTMQLGFIGLFASVSTRLMGMTDNDTRALTTAILAISANEVIQWLKRNGWLRFMPDMGGGNAGPETRTDDPDER